MSARRLFAAVALLALAGCADDPASPPVACGRWDLNVGLECAEVPGVPIPPDIAAGDPGLYVVTVNGVSLLVVHDCSTQCSPYRTPPSR